MTRVRWFQAEWPISIRALSARMRQHAFTENAQDGFLVDRAREERIEGRYVEKLSYTETVVNPFGQELSFERVVYRQVEFTIYRDFPQIELRDPPRGLQSFTSRLVELTEFRMSTAPVSVDVMKWVEALKLRVEPEIVVDTVQVSEVVFMPEITGTLLLKSRRDVRKALKDIVGPKTHTVDKARVAWVEDGSPVVVQLTNGGLVRIDAGRPEHVTLLRESLPKP